MIWQEEYTTSSAAFVSHDGLQTVHVVNGLSDALVAGIRDLAISGSYALAAERSGVWRSTDGGFNFPAAYPVLWHSSGGYQINAVWTNGSHCAAAGSGGSAASGIWHSPTGESGTWTQVLSTADQSWLDGTGGSTIISGTYYGGQTMPGYLSTDSGASWDQLPLNMGSVNTEFQRPFISGSRVLSYRSYDVFDPGSGTFIPYCDGPFIYELDDNDGNDMDPGFPSDEQILNVVIVETADPFFLAGEYQGQLWWYRMPGGWPASFDFEPPWPGGVYVLSLIHI